jgi:hypothetical protein
MIIRKVRAHLVKVGRMAVQLILRETVSAFLSGKWKVSAAYLDTKLLKTAPIQ